MQSNINEGIYTHLTFHYNCNCKRLARSSSFLSKQLVYNISRAKLPFEELTRNQYIRFNTSVHQATWDDTEKKWKVDVRVSNGKDSEYTSAYTVASDYLVSAVGKSETSFQAIPLNDSTDS